MMKVDYTGTYCFGTLNGSEILRNPTAKAALELEPPTLVSPSHGVTLNGIVPQFTLKAGHRSGVTGQMEYILQVANDAAFTSIAATFFQNETLPDTTIATGYSFLNSRTYYWRARTVHDHDDLSEWSSPRTFKTPVPNDGGGGSSGLNLKRGGPEISNDFITFFTLGRWVGVDIAGSYDDTRQPLTMMWYQHGASTDWGYPYYKPYGAVNCK
jgi:hypothetical protein